MQGWAFIKLDWKICANVANTATLKITDAKLYVPIVTLSAEDFQNYQNYQNY